MGPMKWTLVCFFGNFRGWPAPVVFISHALKWDGFKLSCNCPQWRKKNFKKEQICIFKIYMCNFSYHLIYMQSLLQRRGFCRNARYIWKRQLQAQTGWNRLTRKAAISDTVMSEDTMSTVTKVPLLAKHCGDHLSLGSPWSESFQSAHIVKCFLTIIQLVIQTPYFQRTSHNECDQLSIM